MLSIAVAVWMPACERKTSHKYADADNSDAKDSLDSSHVLEGDLSIEIAVATSSPI